jgi:hypothetical protein
MVEYILMALLAVAGVYLIRKAYELYILIKLTNYIAKGDKEKSKNSNGDGIY